MRPTQQQNTLPDQVKSDKNTTHLSYQASRLGFSG